MDWVAGFESTALRVGRTALRIRRTALRVGRPAVRMGRTAVHAGYRPPAADLEKHGERVRSRLVLYHLQVITAEETIVFTGQKLLITINNGAAKIRTAKSPTML